MAISTANRDKETLPFHTPLPVPWLRVKQGFGSSGLGEQGHRLLFGGVSTYMPEQSAFAELEEL